MKRTTAALSLLGLALVAGTASAHDRSFRTTAVPNKDLPSSPHETSVTDDRAFLENDKLFLWRIHWINHSEIQAGEIARRNGNKALAEFGATLVKDHRKAEAAVAKLAAKKDLTLELSREEYQRVRESLTKDMMMQMDLAHERGAGFEREFLRHMAEGHEAALRFLRDYRTKTDDEDIRKFIDEVLPAIQEHHRTANVLLGTRQGDRQDVRGLGGPEAPQREGAASPKGEQARKGLDDGDVEEKLKGLKSGDAKKKEKKKQYDQPEEGTQQQEEIQTDIERRLEPPADSGGTPDLTPL